MYGDKMTQARGERGDWLRLVTLNLWNLNPPLKQRMAALDAQARSLNADIYCFQEVSPVQPARLQLTMVEALRGFNISYAQTGEWKGRPEGLATLSRRAASDSIYERLPGASSDMDRGLLVTRYGRLFVINTHWAYRIDDEELRQMQARHAGAIIKELTGNKQNQVVFCGDLNTTADSRTVQLFLKQTGLLHVLDPSPDTFSSKNIFADPALTVDRAIDHIFVSPNIEFRSPEVLSSVDGIHASDHFAVSVDIRPRK
ncbi:endonuclease/exonuclease/phosphatase family protein [Rhodococcus sp. 14-1411-2a]|uniref:endonuclease/exonuclease/phosphatase family protein n=1 Tax=Rhodococcus sp. 14-1411-2a TaxID=2023151 RepID=UPI000B9AE688|nr:endonuclease/exonuclease/phosphatase family protein [Rhodococcus sp. 14-1411-2a]OZF45365.1 hypothetical protein CH291_17895 [Rhodococcus sp. 14-1411-2a]